MKDVFGNYVVQKVLECGVGDHIQSLFDQMKGNILTLSKHIYGWRVVQKFIEILESDRQQEILKELNPFISEWVNDVYGNHVIQKAIERISYDEISSWIPSFQQQIEDRWKELCMNTYGWRVIQRILENFPEKATNPLYDDIINNHVLDLSKDQFGNYVIQLILEKGKRPNDKKSIWDSLLGNARQLSIHKYASNVVEKCIEHCRPEEQTKIIQELLGGEELAKEEAFSLYKMMDNKYGNYVVQKAIEGASEEQRLTFATKIKNLKMFDGQTSNYVKHVINWLDRLSISST